MPISKTHRRDASLIRALQYFEAVARHQSVKMAAAELGVSQSAVSHQLRELSDKLGEQLLVRSGRGIALTATGLRLSEQLASTFTSLHSSIEDIVGSGRQTLRLAVCSSFGPGWLIGRLQDFLDKHPEIDLQLRLYAHDPEMTDKVADAFVTALPVNPGYKAVHIMDEMLVAVAAPLVEHDPADGKLRLITTFTPHNPPGEDWMDFCKQANIRLSDIQRGPFLQCTHYLLAIEMAKAGIGIALVPDFLAKRGIDSGNLQLFDKAKLAIGRSYHLCFKHARERESGIQKLVHWIKGQIVSTTVVSLFRKSVQ